MEGLGILSPEFPRRRPTLLLRHLPAHNRQGHQPRLVNPLRPSPDDPVFCLERHGVFRRGVHLRQAPTPRRFRHPRLPGIDRRAGHADRGEGSRGTICGLLHDRFGHLRRLGYRARVDADESAAIWETLHGGGDAADVWQQRGYRGAVCESGHPPPRYSRKVIFAKREKLGKSFIRRAIHRDIRWVMR